ncbi:LOW QUALITY PROTEIN: putative innexin [Schistosoma mansoni]|uniref:putative innexin n=1 Tax=Schistosoma mansoni TaxID=6183 RepID=UPI00022DBF9B|nr:LOW QUALITY PROTEIN: putative innexin [Schistosoma mansoni]|eukprot:XP_018651592.1 LOW QUALITY PROTEIN: putative innexin [Schistosoma mansoni]
MDAAFIWNLSKLGRIGSRRLQFDDDFADRLNYQYTSVLLFLFIGLIGVRQYVGKPIQCWIPQEFTRGWEEYAENYCWVANTYFAPVENRLPPIPDRRESLLVYYQWAPIVMAAQALLFYLPCLLWRLGMAHSGFNLHRILQMAAEANEILPEATAKTVHILSYYMKSCIQRQRLYKYTNQYKDIELDNQFDNETIHEGEQFLHTCILDNNKDQTMNTNLVYTSNHVCPNELIKGENSFHIISKTFNDKTMSMVKLSNEQMIFIKQTRNLFTYFKCHLLWCGKQHGNYLVTLYMFVKFSYLSNVIGQIYLMQYFIGTKYTLYGAQVLIDLIKGQEWHHSGHFPRVTFCDLEAKKLGKNHV